MPNPTSPPAAAVPLSGDEVEQNPLLPGCVVSLDPLVTYSRIGKGAPVGLASVRPDAFRGRRALHFVGLSFSLERAGMVDKVAQRVRRLEAEIRGNRIIILANSELEVFLLSQVGVATMLASNLIFIDEATYRPLAAPSPDLPVFDAVYNARLDRMKRHELATGIERLMLMYDISLDSDGQGEARVRALLPHAWYAQHELNGGQYQKSSPETVVQLLNQCKVGLCLSAVEGAMRASMEYLLCGLKVVSTPSIGGRDRYFSRSFVRVATPDAEAVAAAVREMASSTVPREAVRNYTLAIVGFERRNFLAAANRIAGGFFGRPNAFPSFQPFMQFANVWRPTDELIAPMLGS